MFPEKEEIPNLGSIMSMLIGSWLVFGWSKLFSVIDCVFDVNRNGMCW